eukprot:TRINITY_DN23386_c0_g1_i1.p2 TRINITY_DN23386_c0_g1~~TRINITY_DN23386_c0_g1_i1.p2  ORF type:complete len:150 (-),score=33.96 TRINITY_DN23386_c0_g1_i1:181-630(-)
MDQSRVVRYFFSSATYDLSLKKRQVLAGNLLASKKIDVVAVDLSQISKTERDAAYRAAGGLCIPMVFLGDHFIGTFEDLELLEEARQLEGALRGPPLWTPETHRDQTAQARREIVAVLTAWRCRPECELARLPAEILFRLFELLAWDLR